MTQLQNEKKKEILLALTHNIAVIQSSSYYTLKTEPLPRITIFGLKMLVNSGLEKIFLKFLQADNYFSLIHK